LWFTTDSDTKVPCQQTEKLFHYYVLKYSQVLDKNAKNFSLDQYAASMAVNGFRGYMSEYMKNILPKHTAKEAKTKRKRNKDDSTVMFAHNNLCM